MTNSLSILKPEIKTFSTGSPDLCVLPLLSSKDKTGSEKSLLYLLPSFIDKQTVNLVITPRASLEDYDLNYGGEDDATQANQRLCQ